jgi:hypothetical protein
MWGPPHVRLLPAGMRRGQKGAAQLRQPEQLDPSVPVLTAPSQPGMHLHQLGQQGLQHRRAGGGAAGHEQDDSARPSKRLRQGEFTRDPS